MTDETRALPTSAHIEAIRQRADAATEGPWYYDGSHPEIVSTAVPMPEYRTIVRLFDQPQHVWGPDETRDRYGHGRNPNCEFIAHARTDVPTLLAALDGERRHRADLERQLEDTARALVLFGGHRVTCEYAERCTCGFDVARDEAARRLARQVVQETETP